MIKRVIPLGLIMPGILLSFGVSASCIWSGKLTGVDKSARELAGLPITDSKWRKLFICDLHGKEFPNSVQLDLWKPGYWRVAGASLCHCV
jgi:hypothetical protein